MTNSLKALMKEAIDYAGLFPPASLSMEKTVVNYSRYLEDRDSWMLSHFVLPTTRFTEFRDVHKGLSKKGAVWWIAALGREIEAPDRLLECILRDADAIKGFVESMAGEAVVDLFEVRLHSDLTSQIERLEKGIDDASKIILDATLPCQIRVYYEASIPSPREVEIGSVIHAIAKHNTQLIKQSTPHKPPMAGFKLRCGGVKAEQFPSAEQVACCMKTCIDEGVSLKLTSGLHHPFRHLDRSAQIRMHGFINIFTAILLTNRHKLDVKTLTEIIEDENPSHFRFGEQRLSWNDLSITADQIADGRKDSIVSFGSCSFDEPREYLQGLGLL